MVCQQCKSTCEDGVLADFDRGVVERTGNQPKELLDRKEETLETHRKKHRNLGHVLRLVLGNFNYKMKDDSDDSDTSNYDVCFFRACPGAKNDSRHF